MTDRQARVPKPPKLRRPSADDARTAAYQKVPPPPRKTPPPLKGAGTPAAPPQPPPPPQPPQSGALEDEDRPDPVAGEVLISESDRTNPNVITPPRKTTTAVLEAYADDARMAVDDYEQQLIGEQDVPRRGRLHYEIGRLYETVIGDLVKASQHYDQALSGTPDHLPSVAGARRTRIAAGQYDRALELFDREIRATSDRARSSALWFAKARLLEDQLRRSAEARAAFQAAADLSDGDPSRLKALEEADRQRRAWPSLSAVFGQTANALRGDGAHRALVLSHRARIEEVFSQNSEGSAELYEDALSTDPDVPGALHALERLHEEAARWHDLIRVLEREAELAQDRQQRALALHRIGRLRADRLGNLEAAIQAMEAATRASPEPMILDALAELQEQAREYAAQAETLSRLAELTTDDAERLRLLQRIGELCHARLGDDEAAIDALEAGLEIDPASVPVLRIIAPIYWRREAWAELVRLHEREAEATTDTRRRSVAHARAAEILERTADEAAAIGHLEQAYSLDPRNAGCFLSLVRLYRRGQEWRKLVDMYERGLDDQEEERKIAHLFEISNLLAGPLGEPERAEHALRRVLRIQPRNLSAVHALQRVSEEAGRYEQVVKALELEAEIIDDDKQIVPLLHRAGEVLDERLGARTKALAHFQRVLGIDEHHLPTLAHMGRIFHEEKRWTQLVETFERELEATERGPRTVALLQRMGEVYQRELAQPDRAATCYRRALEIDPRYAPAVRGLTRILEQQSAYKAIATLHERELEATQDAEARSLAALRAGTIYEERLDDLTAAERCYLEALGQQPDDPTIRRAVSRVRTKLARWPALGESLEEDAMRAATPEESIAALIRAGEVWADNVGDVRRAAKCYVSVLELAPRNLGALVALETLYRQAKAWDQLAELYARMVDVVQDRGAKVAALAERARLLERERIGTTDDVVDCYTSILSLRPNDLGALLGLERHALRGHDPQVLAAVDSRMAASTSDPELRAAYLARRGESLELAGNPEALDVYRDALAHDDQSRAALRGLARIAEVLGDDEALAEAYRKSAGIARDALEEADSHARAGRVYMERIGDPDEACADFERALELWPDHEDAAMCLSEILGAAGSWASLVDRLTRAAADAKDPRRVAALWLEVSQIHARELSDLVGSIHALRKLLEIQPRNVSAMVELGELFLEDRRVDEAIELLERALSLRPPDDYAHRAHVLLANAHDREGEADAAFRHYASALDLQPEDSETLHRVTDLQMRRGLHAAAVNTAQRLLALAEDDLGRVDAMVQIARAQSAMGRVDDAVDSLAEAVALEGTTGSSASEMVRLAATIEHWERYVDGLQAFLAERAPKGERTRAALYTEIARTQHERLQDDEGALATLIEALTACDGDPQLRFMLAQRLRSTRRHGDAAEQLQQVIMDDVTRGEAWRLLAQTFEELGLPREYEIAVVGLAVLGEATHRDLDIVRAWRPYTRGIPPGGITPANCPELVVAPDQQQSAATLLAAICDGLGKLRPPDLAAWGVSSRDRIPARTEHPLRSLVDRVAYVVGVEECDLYIHRVPGRGVGLENTSRPSLLLPVWVGELTPSQQVFLVTTAMVELARGTYPTGLMTPRELEIVLAAATRAVVPGFGERVAPVEILDDKQRLLMRGLPRRKRKALEHAAALYARARPVDMQTFKGWADQTSRRIALLCADDLVGSLELLRRLEELGSAQGQAFVRASPIVQDLMQVWVAPATMNLRRKLRLLPTPTPSGGHPRA